METNIIHSRHEWIWKEHRNSYYLVKELLELSPCFRKWRRLYYSILRLLVLCIIGCQWGKDFYMLMFDKLGELPDLPFCRGLCATQKFIYIAGLSIMRLVVGSQTLMGIREVTEIYVVPVCPRQVQELSCFSPSRVRELDLHAPSILK